jgi:hypothetical protein
MDKMLQRKINFLTGYAILSSIGIAFFILSSFGEKDKILNVDELTLKKLNVIGEDGKLRLVISNEKRQHPGIIEGQPLPKRERPAGIIFFNNKGDECGGLVAEVNTKKGVTNSAMSFTMDNYNDDQVIQLINDETYENGNASIVRGLRVNEFPVGTSMMASIKEYNELEKIKDPQERKEKQKEMWSKRGSKRRLFIGRSTDNDTGLFLYDTTGKPKMKIYVDKTGKPRIETIDDDGKSKNILIDTN